MGWKSNGLGAEWQVVDFIGGDRDGAKLWINTDKPSLRLMVVGLPRGEHVPLKEQLYSVFFNKGRGKYEARFLLEVKHK